jgi:hypothetical protein
LALRHLESKTQKASENKLFETHGYPQQKVLERKPQRQTYEVAKSVAGYKHLVASLTPLYIDRNHLEKSALSAKAKLRLKALPAQVDL